MPLERIGVIGDIHAEDLYLEQAIQTLRARGVQLVVATGDVADGVGSVDACCELLMAHSVLTVRGNHDRWLLAGTARELPNATALDALSERSRRFLGNLPTMAELETERGRALLCHGIGPNDMAKLGPDDFGYALETNDDLQNLIRERTFRWVINGHSHRRMVRMLSGLCVINAGTLTRDQSPCFLELDFRQNTVTAFEFTAAGTLAESSIPLPESGV